MTRLKPFQVGLLGWLAIVSAFALCVGFLGRRLPVPSPELMRMLAEIGSTILLAYVIEATWMATRLNRESEEERENWLGTTVGFGLGGLTGIVIALLVAEHRAAGHANYLDHLGLWWSTLAIGTLGVTVVLQPIIVARWTRAKPDSD